MPKPKKNVHEVITAYKNKTVLENYSYSKHENSAFEFYKGSYECADFSSSYFASDHIMNNIQNNIREINCNFLMDAFKIRPFGEFYQFLIIYVAFWDQVLIQIYNK